MDMSFRLPPFPTGLAKVLGRLPQYPHGVAFAALLNVALSGRVRPADLQPLHGKHVCVRVTDLGIELHLGVTQTAFIPRSRGSRPDLTISASAHDFLLLALRREDPDTLFFQRRLVMEGDTELGLYVKNLLDGLESPLFGFGMGRFKRL